MVQLFAPQKPSAFLLFSRSKCAVSEIGYDDFHTVTPLFVPRMQEKFTLHIIISGQGTLHLDGKTFYPKAGDIFVIPPSASLCYYPSEQDPWRYVWFGVSEEWGERFAGAGFSLLSPLFSPADSTPLLERVAYMAEQCQSDSWEDLLLAEATLNFLLFSISREKRQRGIFLPQREEGDTASLLADELLSLIRVNYANPDLSVEMLCRMAKVSHSYACRFFKAKKGMTIRRALTNQRMAAARAMLAEGKTAAATAAAVGYRDPVHFSKDFLARNGQTPGAYRKSNQDIELPKDEQ